MILKNDRIFEIVQFEELTNFLNLKIWKIEKKLNLPIWRIKKKKLPFGKSIFYNLKN